MYVTSISRIKGEYFGVKFLNVATTAHRVATDPHSPAKNRNTVETIQYKKLKSDKAIVARTSIEKNATIVMIRKLFQGVTISTSTPPRIPE